MGFLVVGLVSARDTLPKIHAFVQKAASYLCLFGCTLRSLGPYDPSFSALIHFKWILHIILPLLDPKAFSCYHTNT